MKSKPFSIRVALFIISLCFFNVTIKAQNSSAKVVHDDPSLGLTVKLTPFYFDFNAAKPSAQTTSMGIGGDIGLDIKKNFRVTAKYLHASILDNMGSQVDGSLLSSDVLGGSLQKEDFVRFRTMELGGYFFIINKIKKENIQVIKSSISTYGPSYGKTTSVTTETEYYNQDALTRRSFAARGGLYSYKHNISILEHGNVFIEPARTANGVIASDGTALGYIAPTGSGLNVNAYPVLSVNGVYAGLAFVKMRNIKVLYNNDYHRYNKTLTEFYFDIFMGSPKISDVEIAGTVYTLQGGLAQGFETKSSGWRMGIRNYGGHRGLGFNYFAEMGSRPGLSEGNFFMTMGFGFSISSYIKALAPNFEASKKAD
jgi:hypothetical protein